MKNRTPHTLALKVLIFSDSNQSDLKLDYDAVTTKPTTFNPARKMIPIHFKNINQNLMLLLNIRMTRWDFGPRLLHFGHSLYHLALDLSLATQNIGRYYTYSPASAYV